MTIHPFQKSLRGSPRPRGWPCSSEFNSSPELTGEVSAVAPLGHAGASPAFFSCFNRSDHTQQDQRHVPILVTEFRMRDPQGRDLSSRAEQIRVAAILAERATADLLARAVQLRNSIPSLRSQRSEDDVQDVEKAFRESPSVLFA